MGGRRNSSCLNKFVPAIQRRDAEGFLAAVQEAQDEGFTLMEMSDAMEPALVQDRRSTAEWIRQVEPRMIDFVHLPKDEDSVPGMQFGPQFRPAGAMSQECKGACTAAAVINLEDDDDDGWDEIPRTGFMDVARA